MAFRYLEDVSIVWSVVVSPLEADSNARDCRASSQLTDRSSSEIVAKKGPSSSAVDGRIILRLLSLVAKSFRLG